MGILFSGTFKKLSSNLLSLLFTPMDFNESQELSVLRRITMKLSSIRSTEPMCFLKWLFAVQTLGVSDVEFWKEFYGSESNVKIDDGLIEYNKWKEQLIKDGSLLLYCDVVVSRFKVYIILFLLICSTSGLSCTCKYSNMCDLLLKTTTTFRYESHWLHLLYLLLLSLSPHKI